MASAGVRPSRAAISLSASALADAAEDRLGDLARQPPACLDQPVRLLLVEAQLGADRRVNRSKPPETSAVQAPWAFMVATSATPAGGQRQAPLDDAVDHGVVQAGKQRHPFAQRRFEGDLAIHRPAR